MVFKKCPGQDLGRKKIEDVVCNLPCLRCGEKVEFFFDDKTRKCPSCGSKISKSDIQLLKDFGCADWCNSAEKCLGDGLFQKLKQAKKKQTK
jgi:hypothetical protein